MQNTLRFALWIVLVSASTLLKAADYTVTAEEFESSYTINGQPFSPTLTLTRGQTYTFEINASSVHPFVISTEDFDFNVPGVTGNDTHSGTITYVVPMDAPDTMLYLCSLHFFGGTINIIDPELPNVKIVSVSLTSSNVTLISTGTNGWTGIPEFSSNLLSGAWAVVPGYSNSFNNGTNTAVFPRLEVICGPNVFLRVKNVPE